jgi:Ca2+-binding RTX toxin-like protein
MALVVHDWGRSRIFSIARSGDQLVANELNYREAPQTIACTGGNPTVNNVDRIVARQTEKRGSYSVSRLDIDMGKGRFSPGATPEQAGRSEIEVSVDLPRTAVSLEPPPGANRLRFGVKRHNLAVNVNGDDDLDVTLDEPFLVSVYAGEGGDLIDARTGRKEPQPRRPRLFLLGEGGDDRLLGGGDRDELLGGLGADVVRGAKGGGLLEGDEGPDKLIAGDQQTLFIAGPGPDRIDARNGQRDWIGCGPGRDNVIADHREDHISGCEHVRPRDVKVARLP